MSEVWEAEQQPPIRRRVALKLIKRGMGSREVLARFESERQALALMSHPSIARIYDAGVTAQGRPYFAMEYVPGVTVIEYCDTYRLTVRERLELFVQVCQGVQHAHQKGVIHRDVKPSNVLVTVEDGRPSLGDASVVVAKNRRSEPASLERELTGDLDWIAMKALEKDRTRRYGSPSELAADLERHLRHRPVVAGPPSGRYRLGKFVRRHRLGVAAATLAAVALMLGLVVAGLGLATARRLEERGEAP